MVTSRETNPPTTTLSRDNQSADAVLSIDARLPSGTA
jgi:hypothetical protein